MEYGDNWYLVGIRAADLSGCRYGFNRAGVKADTLFAYPAHFGGGHTTIEHERRTPIAGGN